MIHLIPTPLLEPAWLLVQTMLEKVAPYGKGYWTLEDLHRDLSAGTKHLVVSVTGVELTGVLVVSYHMQGGEKVAWVTAAAGSGFFVPETWEQVKRLFQSHGAQRIEAVMRPSVVRLCHKTGIGFTEKRRVYEVAL